MKQSAASLTTLLLLTLLFAACSRKPKPVAPLPPLRPPLVVETVTRGCLETVGEFPAARPGLGVVEIHRQTAICAWAACMDAQSWGEFQVYFVRSESWAEKAERWARDVKTACQEKP